MQCRDFAELEEHVQKISLTEGWMAFWDFFWKNKPIPNEIRIFSDNLLGKSHYLGILIPIEVMAIMLNGDGCAPTDSYLRTVMAMQDRFEKNNCIEGKQILEEIIDRYPELFTILRAGGTA